ncbi:MAG: hypothetical protein ACJZ39_06895 [Candidatus Thalassarchaeaceae archaeon]
MMNIEYAEMVRLAEEIDSENASQLAEIFIQLLQIEYASRHKSRPKIIQQFTEILDKMEGE